MQKTAQWFFFVSLRDYEKYSSCSTVYSEIIYFPLYASLIYQYCVLSPKTRVYLICVYIEGRTILHFNAKNIGVNRNYKSFRREKIKNANITRTVYIIIISIRSLYKWYPNHELTHHNEWFQFVIGS